MAALEVERLPRGSVVGHFRVWKDVYEALEGEARTRKVSLNTLVNQVLSTHTTDDVLFEEEGFMKITKNTYRVILSLLPVDKLSELGRLAAKSGADARMLERSHCINCDTVLEELRLLSRSGWFALNEEKKNGKEVVSLIHDLGPRDSVVLTAYLAGLFALAGVHPKTTVTDSSVMIEC